MSEGSDALLDQISEETWDFWAPRAVRRLENPTALEFMRDAVAQYQPVIITGLVDDWEALSSWNMAHLQDKLSEPVRINLTPDGHGDCVKMIDSERCDGVVEDSTHIDGPKTSPHFVYPAETLMPFAQFDNLIASRDHDVVPYLSEQNDNLRSRFSSLLPDIRPSIALADEAFGTDKLEAINLWIGDERSVSSMHKDHYENMYVVISGEKTFTLMPPTDVAFLEEKEYPSAQYIVNGDGKEDASGHIPRLSLSKECCPYPTVSWIDCDPNDPLVLQKHPRFSRAHPVRCTVQPGEILYIPAMWYHRVSQTKLTIAVNYWYDQQFDFRYVLVQTAKVLGTVCTKLAEDERNRNSENNQKSVPPSL